MPFLAIVAMGIGSAVVNGVVHDQVTVRVCLEYFTIGHPRVFSTESPTWLALGWGIIASGWVGFLLGVFVALTSGFVGGLILCAWAWRARRRRARTRETAR